jgi:hypothetical protein
MWGGVSVIAPAPFKNASNESAAAAARLPLFGRLDQRPPDDFHGAPEIAQVGHVFSGAPQKYDEALQLRKQ